MPWYEGSSLIEALDKLKAPLLLDKKPLRIPLQDIWKIRGVSGRVVSGKVATGTLFPGMKLYFAPIANGNRLNSFTNREKRRERMTKD